MTGAERVHALLDAEREYPYKHGLLANAADAIARDLDAGDAAIARVTELEVEREVQQGYRECMTDAAELLAAEVRRLRAMVLRMHASSVETNVFAGGWRAASLLRHYADGIESGRIP